MKRIVFICLSLLLISCHDIDKPKKPKNLLSKSQMVNVIVDMSLLTSAKGLNKYELQSKRIMPEDYIFNKHGVDSLQFALSNEYYSYDIEIYESIYLKVYDSLQAMKTKFNKLDEEKLDSKQKKDSLRRINLNDSSSIKRNEMINKRLMKPPLKSKDSLL